MRLGFRTGRVDWSGRSPPLAVIFLGLYAFEVLDTRLSGSAREAVDLGLTAIWVLFGIDYLVRLVLAGDCGWFVRTHLLDLMILLLTLSTITTTGYGDVYPVTAEGRVVAGALMIAGIALLGVITGSFANWFVENLRQVEEDAEQTGDRITAKLDQLLVEVRLLTTRIQRMETRSAGPVVPPDT